MTTKDVIAQAEIKFSELRLKSKETAIIKGEGDLTNWNIENDKIKSFLSTYTKDLLQSVVEMTREEIKIAMPLFGIEHSEFDKGYNAGLQKLASSLSDIISKLK